MEKGKNYKGMVSEVDPIAIRKLYYEYRMTNQEISDMTWETKANINKILNQGIKYYNPWIEHHLIKLGLVPYGDIRPITAYDPTLTFNTIGRHQSMLVRTRIASTGSPWLSKCTVGDQYTVAISHGEGRFVAPQEVLDTLVKNGQVATQYVDIEGNPTMDQSYNPNGSVLAIEGITSPDGRVFGKMGHSERSGEYLYKNVTGDKYQPIFEGGVDYFKV